MKKVFGLSVVNLTYLLGFLAVPIFAYLILLDTQSQILEVYSLVLGIVLIYVCYIIYGYKSKNPFNTDESELNLFSFQGRIRRSQYIYIILTCSIIFITASNIFITYSTIGSILIIALYIVLAWICTAQEQRRCHDRNVSGWWQLIPFYSLWMTFGDSDRNQNVYGKNTKNKTISDEVE